MTDKNRWAVSVIYRCEIGPVVIDHDIDELDELHDLIERGPDWNAIMDICVQLNSPDETVVLQSPLQERDI